MENRILALSAAASILAAVSSCAQPTKSDSLSEAYGDLVIALGDPSLSLWRKETARSMLVHGDKEVIPVLISALQDGRTFDPEYLAPSASIDTLPRIQTVGQVCDEILHQVISGDRSGRYPVSDWSAWWDRHKAKNLSEMIEMVQAALQPIK